jgi:hypothetical protein
MTDTAGVPCALKAYHLPDEKWMGFEECDEARTRIKEWATTEANNWNAI